MLSHQLDLFGGPLKPPKKIKVDDDVPADEPIEAAPVVSEPVSTAAELIGDETIVIDALPGEPGQFHDEDLVTNDLEWSPEYQEEENRVDGTEVSEPYVEPVGEMEEIPSEEEEPGFTDEAIFTTEISDSPSEDETTITTVNVEEPQAYEESIEPAAVSTTEPVVSRLKKVEEEDGLNIPPDEELFKRQYYSMRETSSMFGVNQSLLRFWENEFDILQPKKNKKGDRYFRPVDIKNLVLIFHLLRVRKFTLEGAKDYLNSHKKAADSFELVKRLEKLKSFLFELKAGL